jgi:hypothetical protein
MSLMNEPRWSRAAARAIQPLEGDIRDAFFDDVVAAQSVDDLSEVSRRLLLDADALNALS